MKTGRRWHLFCRVVDNFGDVGVAWRLAADLGSRGERVRLHIDDASALRWMAPAGAPGVEVAGWDDDPADLAPTPADVLVETFGCGLPQRVLDRMTAAAAATWIDVEYLSAEAYVERSHGLPSPVKMGADRWLTRHFFFPGFTPRSGGLLREPGLRQACDRFDRGTWLADAGIDAPPGERLVSLFGYTNAALPALIDALAGAPTLLLGAPGPATDQAAALLGRSLRRGSLRLHALPWLSQPGYDRLLWSCDLNLVRGEDSFVRAHWAGAPFVWQAYPQTDDAHAAKLTAFMNHMLDGVPAPLAAALRRLWLTWNGLDAGAAPSLALPSLADWTALARRWRGRLETQPDLTTRLIAFVDERTAREPGQPPAPT